MPRAGESEQPLLEESGAGCGAKAKALCTSKSGLGLLAVAVVGAAAVGVVMSVDFGGKKDPGDQVPEEPETPDNPDHGLEYFHCDGEPGNQTCSRTWFKTEPGHITYKNKDCNNSCTAAAAVAAAPVAAAPEWVGDFPCMGGTCSGTGICCSASSLGPCCPDPAGVCCPAGCCPAGHSCCQTDHCCPAGTTCCPEGGCCPAGTTCAGGNTCKRMEDDGSVVQIEKVFAQQSGGADLDLFSRP
jgi:hypothetical protein